MLSVTNNSGDIRWEGFVFFWGWLGWIWQDIFGFWFYVDSIKKIFSDDAFVLSLLIFNLFLHLKPRNWPRSNIFTLVRIYWVNLTMGNFNRIFDNIELRSMWMHFWLIESKGRLHFKFLLLLFCIKRETF